MVVLDVSKVSANWKSLQAKLKGSHATTTTTTGDSESDKKELWFEVDEQSLAKSRAESAQPASLISLFPNVSRVQNVNEVGKYIAMDCEYVGAGPEGQTSVLARVTLVNWHGMPLLDTFVKPSMSITDYRTAVSGVRPADLFSAPNHLCVLKTVSALIGKDTVLVGHGLDNDLRVMMFSNPKRLVRDTSKYRPFRRISRGKTPSLKRLCKEILGVDIQQGEHDSLEDARAAMLLYRRHKEEWEGCLCGAPRNGNNHQTAKATKGNKKFN